MEKAIYKGGLSTGDGDGGNKRNFDDILDPTPEDFAEMSRSERKRHREKRRRGKVNAGFDDLKGLLMTIDSEVNYKDDINRVDLIARAVVVMKNLYDENQRVKRQLHSRAQEQVTIAVPYLVPKDDHRRIHQSHMQPHQFSHFR